MQHESHATLVKNIEDCEVGILVMLQMVHRSFCSTCAMNLLLLTSEFLFP